MGPLLEMDSTVGNVAVKPNSPREWTRIHNEFQVDLLEVVVILHIYLIQAKNQGEDG
jgi:hypothetical protein